MKKKKYAIIKLLDTCRIKNQNSRKFMFFKHGKELDEKKFSFSFDELKN